MQRSLNIPNLTRNEVKEIFEWYEKETNHVVEPAVVDRLYYETNGLPGLTCWFGELLTEGFEYYSVDKSRPLSMNEFDKVYGAAIDILPNNNILNIISKAKKEPGKTFILKWNRIKKLYRPAGVPGRIGTSGRVWKTTRT